MDIVILVFIYLHILISTPLYDDFTLYLNTIVDLNDIHQIQQNNKQYKI